MTIPFFSGAKSLKAQWAEVTELLDHVTGSGRFTNGPLVQQFEQAIIDYTEARYAVAMGNATDALIIMLKAAGIGPGDEVIVPCYTFFASASSIAHVGARPVFVDIDPLTYSLDPAQLEAKITARTRAIMPVHLFSQMADMPAILEIAARHKLQVLEDSAEGIGMWCGQRHAGLLGRAGVLSFFPTKTLGAIGDAGMVLTNDEELARACRLLRNHGQAEDAPYIYQRIGYNSRMDDIQAAILLVRLAHLEEAIAHRKTLAEFYDRRLAGLKPVVSLPTFPRRNYSTNQVYYVYLIEAEDRDGLVAYLNSQGIGTETYYPIPLHLQPCFAYLDYRRGAFPNAERACARTLALPLYPDLTLEQAEEVCQALESFYAQKGGL